MAWRFEPGEDLSDAFRRVAAEEIAKIRAALADGALPARGVHEARQGFKRLRALLRLAGPFEDHQKLFRDAGRQLSGSRDRTVLLESFDKIAAGCDLPPDDVASLRAHLAGNGADGAHADAEARAGGVLAVLDDASARMAALSWPEDADALAKGLKRGQARLKKAWKAAQKSAEPMVLHDWRKRVKDQAAQLRLLRHIAPPSIRSRHGDEKKAAELLGEEHDYWMLDERLRADGIPTRALAVRDRMIAAIGERRDALRKEAFKLGKGFSSEKPKAFARELTAAWEKACASSSRKGAGAAKRATSPRP